MPTALLGGARLAGTSCLAGLGGLLARAERGLAARSRSALGAVQWLPTAERARDGFRAGPGLASRYWSLHPRRSSTWRCRASSPSSRSRAGTPALFEGREPFLACLYLGVVPLALGALGARAAREPRGPRGRGRPSWSLRLGRHTPL